jgi:hypothetical protein
MVVTLEKHHIVLLFDMQFEIFSSEFLGALKTTTVCPIGVHVLMITFRDPAYRLVVGTRRLFLSG